jgi:hypothetical protein
VPSDCRLQTLLEVNLGLLPEEPFRQGYVQWPAEGHFRLLLVEDDLSPMSGNVENHLGIHIGGAQRNPRRESLWHEIDIASAIGITMEKLSWEDTKPPF